MLARLTLLLIAIPALALAADAVPSSGRLRIPHKPAAPAASVQPAATLPVLRPLSPTKAAVDGGECRMGCAQTYYFCRAGDHTEDCAGAWGQCVVTCDSPNLAPGYSTAP